MSRYHRQHRRPMPAEYLGTETGSSSKLTVPLVVDVTAPTERDVRAIIESKEAALKTALSPEKELGYDPLKFSYGRGAKNCKDFVPQAKFDGVIKERDPEMEARSREAIDNGDFTLLTDLIEATKAAQQRNAERLVRERAYFIWEDAGRPDGCDIEHWLRAERDFKMNLYKLLYQHKEVV